MKEKYDNLTEWIEDVKEEGDLYEFVLDKGIALREDFRGGKVRCFFHNEKTGSLQIGDKWYRCYGCGIGGDIISFVQNYYNMDFLDAVRFLAEYYKVSVPRNAAFDKKRTALERQWESFLHEMEGAPEVVKNYRRSFFPQEIGYDSKSKYIVCPLTSKGGGILGFTKRRVDELHVLEDGSFPKWSAKWVHSSLDDSLIDQCHNVFNLDLGSRAIKSTGEVVVCEGPKDAIAYRRDHIEQVVGVCGTSNSNNIWQAIPYSERVYLSFDNDEAGQKATRKTITYLSVERDIKNIFVIIMPQGLDPYDLLIKNGQGSLEQAKRDALPAAEWFAKNSSRSECKELYQSLPAFNRRYFIKFICSTRSMSAIEAESWVSGGGSSESGHDENEIEDLKVWANGGNVPGKSVVPADKARRILHMKYGL